LLSVDNFSGLTARGAAAAPATQIEAMIPATTKVTPDTHLTISTFHLI
jgi:hypothetical protein